MDDKMPLDNANKLFVLRALHEKARRDRKTRGVCRFGTSVRREDQEVAVPDPFFSPWAKRFTEPVFMDYVNALDSEGYIAFFDGVNNEVFFEITERGRIFLQNGLNE
jgi:hypothetical protein